MKRDQQSVKGNEPLNQDPRRLRRRRLAKRLRVTELAAQAGISAGYLSQLEYGKYSASPRILGALADALGCDITDLMEPEQGTASGHPKAAPEVAGAAALCAPTRPARGPRRAAAG